MFKMTDRNLLSAIVIAATIFMVVANRSEAYDQAVCVDLFARANVAKSEQFRIISSPSDFGDDLHVGGDPQGQAVACWCNDGRVAVKGKVYSDGSAHHGGLRPRILIPPVPSLA